jgi:hypothetical protein
MSLAACWVVYSLAPRNQISAINGYLESITISYSVGLALRDPRYQPNPWLSTCHILSGSALIAILLTRAGENIEEDLSMNMLKVLRGREDYERKMRRENPLSGRVDAFVWYNTASLITLALWMVWMAFIVGWTKVVTLNIVDEGQRWGFTHAQYFAVSVCLLAGSLSLPPNSPE